jgi:hypothetical protein
MTARCSGAYEPSIESATTYASPRRLTAIHGSKWFSRKSLSGRSRATVPSACTTAVASPCGVPSGVPTVYVATTSPDGMSTAEGSN